MLETDTRTAAPEETHTGGCQCGSLRYRTRGAPKFAVACHCRYCQTRTGAAFGVSAFFASDMVELTKGTPQTYAFETESGRNFINHFCSNCGSTLLWTIGLFPGLTAVAGGSFDPPSFWFDVKREVFTRSKAPFVNLCLEAAFETSSSYEPRGKDAPRLDGAP